MPGQAPDPTGAKILDAASRVLADFGVKRATVESVAKYAGVSHMTVYRRWSTKNELLRSAVLRELSTVLDTAFANAAEREPDDRVIHAFSDVVWLVRTHPLVVRLSTTEPEVLTGLLSTGSGSIMETAVPQVAARLAGLEPPAGDSDALDTLADVFVRLAHSLVLVQDPDHPLGTRSDVETYATRCLSPFLGDGSTSAAGPEGVTVAVPSPRRGPLMAASLLAVLLVGAGLGATLVQTRRAPMSPDLIRTEQAPTPTVSSTSAVPISPSTVVDHAPVEPPVPPMPAPASSALPTHVTTAAPPSPTAITVSPPSGDGGASHPSGPPPRIGPSFSPLPPHFPNGPGPRGPGSPPGPGGGFSGNGPGGGGSSGGGDGHP